MAIRRIVIVTLVVILSLLLAMETSGCGLSNVKAGCGYRGCGHLYGESRGHPCNLLHC